MKVGAQGPAEPRERSVTGDGFCGREPLISAKGGTCSSRSPLPFPRNKEMRGSISQRVFSRCYQVLSRNSGALWPNKIGNGCIEHCSTRRLAAALFRASHMLMNTGFAPCAGAPRDPTLGKPARGRAMKSSAATGTVVAGNYLSKDLRNCLRLQREIFWVLNTKRESAKLESVNA